MDKRREIRRFISRCRYFALIVLSLCILCVLSYNIGPDHYVRALGDKLDRLDQANRPKVVFVGDSNLAFGINSKSIEDRFGAEVHNTGLLRGMGVAFCLNQVRGHLSSGDKLIICVSYTQLTKGTVGINGNEKLGFVVRTYPSAIRYIENLHQVKAIASGFEKIIRGSLKRHMGLITEFGFNYTRSGFNSRGDYIKNDFEERRFKPNKFKKFFTPEIEVQSIKWLNSVYSELKEEGIEAYFLYPCYAESLYELNPIEFNRMNVELETGLVIPKIGQMTDFLYPDSLFFDNPFHMNSLGRVARTKDIIEAMELKDI
ncbi:MAG: hypothetical protein HKO93_05485 [Flavobacteriales bacterium]|nr:hypothetical protein [Flavobacteriales bacterium]